MPFSCYLIRKYDFIHENQFFRTFSENLKAAFEGKVGEHVLIGNISVNGHAIDAIFLCRGQISIIDFKNYSGRVTFSENNPWILDTSDRKQIFVQGGAQLRNPFQQVKAYRASLSQYLEDNQEEIFEGLRSNIRWSHISGVVLFQNKVSYDENTIPGLIKPWFHIADKDNNVPLLSDKYSSHLDLTDSEIRKILRLLDVSPDNLFERVISADHEPVTLPVKASPEKLAFIKRLIDGNAKEPKYARLLKYYRTLIQIERFKEPTATNLHPFPFDDKQDAGNYWIDISSNNVFHDAWLRNMRERFPKNLFAGVEVTLNGQGRSLLYTILLTSDIGNITKVRFNLNQFELYVRELEHMGLDEGVIEEISSGINQENTLSGKIKVLQSLLSDSIALGSKIFIGLSNESMFTAQLESELSTMAKKPETDQSSVFSSFLHQENKLKHGKPLPLKPFIRISSLNASQQEAIHQAFQQDITVITGPPGTGKSQVVTNILANAVMNNHSVLFASKNNRAVDNVKDRLDTLLEREAILRLGSKEDIEVVTKPKLKGILSKASAGEFTDVSVPLSKVKKTIIARNARIEELQALILKIPQLENQFAEWTANLDGLLQEQEAWLSRLPAEEKRYFVDQGLSFDLDPNEVALMVRKVQEAGSGFFSRMWFNWFQKSKAQYYARMLNNALPPILKSFVADESPWASLKLNLYQSLARNLEFILELYQRQNAIQTKRDYFEDRTAIIKAKLALLQKELDYLVAEKPNFQQEIAAITEELPGLGLEALKLKLADDLHKVERNEVQDYLDYLPAKVWKDQDVEDFTAASMKFLEGFHVVCVTSLSIKNSFPLSEQLFDMVVIDEASQCDLVSALPMIFRAKKAVIIGDPLQLTHITSVQKYEEDFILESLELQSLSKRYVDTSLYDYADALANKCNLKGVFLNEHYRCHPEIINFSNDHFYNTRLGQSMKVMTQAKAFQFGNIGLNWIEIKGRMADDKNMNEIEAETCLRLARKLRQEHPKASIGIVTPFRDQKTYIFEALPKDLRDDIKVDTVHQYQGDEKDIMIFSLVVTDNSPASKAKFLNRNDFLINVAITRAKSSLYIVGNWTYCSGLDLRSKFKSPLYRLANYAQQLNKVTTARAK